MVPFPSTSTCGTKIDTSGANEVASVTRYDDEAALAEALTETVAPGSITKPATAGQTTAYEHPEVTPAGRSTKLTSDPDTVPLFWTA